MKAERKKPETEEEEEEEERKDAELNFDDEEIQRMHELARKLSQKIGQGLLSSKNKEQKSSGDSGSDSKKTKGKSDGELMESKKSESGNKNTARRKSESEIKSESGNKIESGNSNTVSGNKNGNESQLKKNVGLGSYRIKKKAKPADQECKDTSLAETISGTSSHDGKEREKTQSPSLDKSQTKHNRSEKRQREKDDHEKERKHRNKKHKRKDASKFYHFVM